MPAPSWDDPSWREDDTPWRAGCRWLQSWWRSEHLGLLPGPHKPTNPDRLVASMVPLDAPPDPNFLSDEAAVAAERRMSESGGGGLVDEDRLARNLLSSQPMCFNLFGHLQRHADVLVAWLHSLGIEADAVVGVRLEWAPDPKSHFGGGSAFDALVVYRRGSTTGFVGVECKYAENLSDQRIKVRDPYLTFTRESGYWRPGSVERLRANETVQLWLNTLLAQSCVAKGEEGWTEGSVVMLACGADEPAFDAAVGVRSELDIEAGDEGRWVGWSSYETIIDLAARQPELADWADRFRSRYLNFGPVAHLLAEDDPRKAGTPRRMTGDPASVLELSEAISIAAGFVERVFGDGSILEQVDSGVLDDASTIEIATLTTRLQEVAEATRVARIVASPVWDRLVDGSE